MNTTFKEAKMAIEEIRRNAPVGFHRKSIAYRIENGSVKYLIACIGIDGKLSIGIERNMYQWISLETNEPLF